MQKFRMILILFLLPLDVALAENAFRVFRLLDPVTGSWQGPVTVRVKDQKIVSISPVTNSDINAVDLGSTYVVPGLVDSHTHLFLDDPTLGKDFSNGLMRFLKATSPELRKKLGEARMKNLLQAGFTSVRDLGNSGELFPEKLELPDGPRVFSSGRGFVPLHGQLPPGTGKKLLRSEYRSLNDDPEKVLSDFPFSVLKLYADEDPIPTVTDPKLLKSWVDAAHKRSLKVAAHAILKEAIHHALEAGVDSVEHGYFATTEQLLRMKEKDIIFVPTNGNSLLLKLPRELRSPGAEEEDKRVCGLLKTAFEKEVPLAFGSDFYFTLTRTGISFGEATKEALMRFLACGATAAAMIRSATVMGAKALGKGQQLGQLLPGFYADFLVLSEDPLKSPDTLLRPLRVFKGGTEFKKR